MKNKISVIAVLLVSLLCFSSCNYLPFGKKKYEKSSKTGWNYNDPEMGGFDVKLDYKEQATGPGLVFIEGGSFTMGRVSEDVMFEWNNIPRRVTVESFYMDETVVTNRDYLEYLHWLRRVYVTYPQVYRNALPDTLVWLSPLAYNEPLMENYFRHPSYQQYPVVGVSWLKAVNYCDWRTDRVNEMILIDEGITAVDPNQRDREVFTTETYLQNRVEVNVLQNLPNLDPNGEPERRVRREDGILLPKFRLPTEAEWEFSALALVGNTVNERIYERRIFPWNGHVTRRHEKKTRGEMLANFKRKSGDLMGVASSLNDAGSTTQHVFQYWPNDYGLYGMAGNVNEWVMDVYRPSSFGDMEDFNPYRGNQFQLFKLDPATGEPVEKDSLGRMVYESISVDVATNQRRQINMSDYRNYLDGDSISSNFTSDMYDPMLALVTNTVRVYKGGSWRDRPYWLSPGTRRYLEENESKDDLGFRCAMSRVGAQQRGKLKKR